MATNKFDIWYLRNENVTFCIYSQTIYLNLNFSKIETGNFHFTLKSSYSQIENFAQILSESRVIDVYIICQVKVAP